MLARQLACTAYQALLSPQHGGLHLLKGGWRKVLKTKKCEKVNQRQYVTRIWKHYPPRLPLYRASQVQIIFAYESWQAAADTLLFDGPNRDKEPAAVFVLI